MALRWTGRQGYLDRGLFRAHFMLHERAGVAWRADVQRMAARAQLCEAKGAGGIGGAVANGPAGEAVGGLGVAGEFVGLQFLGMRKELMVHLPIFALLPRAVRSFMSFRGVLVNGCPGEVPQHIPNFSSVDEIFG